MNYYVARNGQTYGPYSEDTVRKYVAEGSMSMSDMGCTDANPSWIPLSQLFGGGVPVVQQSVPVPPPPSAMAPPPFATGGRTASGANMPPDLHWGLILLIACFTSGLFLTIWLFIQANWIKSINPASKAIRDLAIAILSPMAGVIVLIVMVAAGGIASAGFDHMSAAAIGSLSLGFIVFGFFCIVGFVFQLKGVFGMRDSMVIYYNSTEPINLRLSAIMTFFFNVFYFQYHMSRIADWKRTGILRP
jgi:hypothetical protein